jgi:DNA-binding XRE family transcriptional regulator
MSFVNEYAKERSEHDPEFKKLWEDEGRQQMFDFIAQIIDLRLTMGMNQSEFARLVGVKQPFISRLENGEQNITVKTLQHILRKTGARLKIERDSELVKN